MTVLTLTMVLPTNITGGEIEGLVSVDEPEVGPLLQLVEA